MSHACWPSLPRASRNLRAHFGVHFIRATCLSSARQVQRRVWRGQATRASLGTGSLCVSELRLQSRLGLRFAVLVSQNPEGCVGENTHVSSPCRLPPPEGTSFPLLFSTVRCPGRSLKMDRLQNSPSVRCDGQILIATAFYSSLF